jgi:hypothetical protein
MVCQHIPGEIPGVVRYLNVDRWQAIIVPPRVAASIHAYSLPHERPDSLQYEPARGAA